MKANKEISKLFGFRDKAVQKQDRMSFLSTQVAEIKDGSSDNYLAIDALKTEILHIHKENELEKVVFVKEIYSPKNNDPYVSFPVYFLVNTVQGWKIYKVK